jgi:uncharacterized protein YdeI (YjbR/CyaY-like superfamily)
MITQIEEYFTDGCGRCDRFATPECSTKVWAVGQAALRRLCLDAGLTEMVKWGHPCYTHAGRNVVIMGAFRGDFRLTFFNAALMTDPEGVLTGQGPHSQHPDCIRFTGNAQVVAMAPVISAYLIEAMGYAQAGVLPVKVVPEIELPDELVEALDMDPELAEAFAALTPGRQRSYVLNLAGAKAAATKVARIAKFRGHILAGKGALER